MSRYRETMAEALKKVYNERTYDPIQFGPDKVAKAMAIATKSSGDYSGAVKDIEKIARNLSKVSTIARELKKQNEEIDFDLTEGRMKDIYTMQQDGKSAKEIAKLMKLPVKTVKDILGEEDLEETIKEFKKMVVDIKDQNKRNKAIDDLKKQKLKVDVYGGRIFVDGKGADLNKYATDLKNFYGANISVREEVELVEFSDAMLDKLAREYEPLRGKTMSVQQANKLRQKKM